MWGGWGLGVGGKYGRRGERGGVGVDYGGRMHGTWVGVVIKPIPAIGGIGV